MIRRMHIAYLDDSSAKDARYRLMAGVILKDSDFSPLEACLGYVIEEYVPENLRGDFEFHATELFHVRGPFKDLTPPSKGLEIISVAMELIADLSLPIIYGAVDQDKLKTVVWANAHPISIGFRICAEAFEQWLTQHAEPSSDPDLGLLILDETRDQEAKSAIRKVFRDCRRLVRSMALERGQLQHIHDDIYFGDSASSCGIQAADICAFLINRHLSGRLDTEHLYKRIEPLIASSRIVPE